MDKFDAIDGMSSQYRFGFFPIDRHCNVGRFIFRSERDLVRLFQFAEPIFRFHEMSVGDFTRAKVRVFVAEKFDLSRC